MFRALQYLCSIAGAVILVACVTTPATVGTPDYQLRAGERPGQGRLYFAGQPDIVALNQLRTSGIDVVVNLRATDEIDWDEAAAASDAGLRYYQIPVSREGPGFDPVAFDAITAIIENNADSDVLLHCSTGNRVSAWYATYLTRQLGLSADDAIAKARLTGLTSDKLEQRIRYYLDATQD